MALIGAALMAAGALCAWYGWRIGRARTGSPLFRMWYGVAAAFAVLGGIGLASAAGALPRAAGVGAVALGIALAAVPAALSARIMLAAHPAPPAGLDWLIVLGAQVRRDGEPALVLRYRLEAACAYLRANPGTRVVVTGGQGPNEPCAEAAAMARWLVRHGIAPARIREEASSTTTVENIACALPLMAAAGGVQDAGRLRVGIVTNDFHLYRALRIARRQGLRHVWGIRARSKPSYLPHNLLRECFAVLKNRLRRTM